MLSLVFEPLAFFRARLARPASWWPALGGPLGCGAVAVVAHAIFSTRIAGPLYEALAAVGVSTAFARSMQYMGVFSVAFIHVLVWLSASAFMIALDVLFQESARMSRILEMNALAFYSQLPWQAALVLVALAFEPPPWHVASDALSPADVARVARLLEQDEMLIAVRTVSGGFTVWLYLLFGAAYHVVADVPLAWALAAGIGMFVALHLLPALS